MTFTVFKEPDTDRIRHYLGLPLSAIADLVVAMESVEAASVDAAKRIRGMLDELDTAEREINQARVFSGQRFANGVTWFQNQRLQNIKAEARRIVFNISEVISVEVGRDIWADVKQGSAGQPINYVIRS